jgi:uncharacterized membrane protein YfcA
MLETIDYILIFISVYFGEMFAAFFGGGSFIIQPALIAIGVDAKISIANDVASTAFAALGFLLHKNIYKVFIENRKQFIKILFVMFPTIVVGTYAGSNFLKTIPSEYVLYGVFIIATIGLIKLIFEHFNLNLTQLHDQDTIVVPAPIKYWPMFLIISAVFLAFYDGISGAGGGTLQILAFAMIFRIEIKKILILSALFSVVSLSAAGINFYFLGLLDMKLMMVMIPASFMAGFTASYCIQFITEKNLRLAFIGVLSALLLYLILYHIVP